MTAARREEKVGVLAATALPPCSAVVRSLIDLPNDALLLIFQLLLCDVDQHCFRTASRVCHLVLPPVSFKISKGYFSNVGRSRARWVWAVSTGLVHPAISIFDQDELVFDQDRSGSIHCSPTRARYDILDQIDGTPGAAHGYGHVERTPCAELPYHIQLSAFTTRYGRLAGCCMLTCWRSYADRGIFQYHILMPLVLSSSACCAFAAVLLLYIEDWEAHAGAVLTCLFVISSTTIFFAWTVCSAVSRDLSLPPDAYYYCALRLLCRARSSFSWNEHVNWATRLSARPRDVRPMLPRPPSHAGGSALVDFNAFV